MPKKVEAVEQKMKARPFRSTAMALLALGALLLVLPAPAFSQKIGALEGKITDGKTGAAVGWALVVVEELNRSVDAAEDGRFSFETLPAGAYTLRILRLGYREYRVSAAVIGGRTTALDIRLDNEPIVAEAVVVEGKADDAVSEIQRPEVVVGGAKLRQNLGRTIAETIANEPGLAQRSMGPAPSRPVLRGLDGERLLVLEDGERTGDLSANSSDHAVAIEPLTTERVEVVRGPEALLYGSNALAGVINVRRGYIPTNAPKKFSASLSWQGESVNTGFASGGEFTAPLGPLALHVDASYRDGRNIATPLGNLLNTQIETGNTSLGLGLIRPWGVVGMAASLYRSDYGIPPDPDGGHPSGVGIALDRQHVESRAELLAPLSWMRRLILRHNYSRYQHEEVEANGNVGIAFGVVTHHASAVARLPRLGPFVNGVVGVWGEYRDQATAGLSFTPPTEEWAGAVFTYQELPLGRLETNFSLRLDGRLVDPAEERHSREVGQIQRRRFAGFSGGISGRYNWVEGVALGASVMRSFSAPGVDALFSEGPHLAAYAYEVGDASLEAERGLGLELTLDYRRGHGHFHLALFRNAIDGYLFPKNTGQYSVRRADLFLYRIAGLRALMYGAEGAFEWHLGDRFVAEGTLSYVRGELSDLDEPIPRLPPLQSRLGLRLAPSEGLSLGTWARLASDQSRVGEFEAPTEGYAVFDIAGQYYFSSGGYLHTFSLALENVADTTHRRHLNRVRQVMPEPGRNLRLLYKVFL